MNLESQLFVSSLEEMPKYVRKYNITHMITLLTSEEVIDDGFELPYEIDQNNWLHVDIRDTSDIHRNKSPKLQNILDVLDWCEKLPKDARLLVHCYAGMSRSTAVALMLAIKAQGTDKIDDCIDWLVKHRPIACPNELMIEYADYIFSTNGKLCDKVNKMIESKLLFKDKINV